jgi:hypothetical protein
MDNCQHLSSVAAPEPPGSYHYGRRVCRDCGTPLGFVSSPTNANLRVRNAKKLKALAAVNGLSESDKGFCFALALGLSPDQTLKLSPKQVQELDRLHVKHCLA